MESHRSLPEFISYAGIGSRETPASIISVMMAFSAACAEAEYTLRSGGAPGADRAFEDGCDLAMGKKEIFLPYRGFNRNSSQLYPSERDQFMKEAINIASAFHEDWGACDSAARLFHGRNVFQVLGGDLRTHSRFVVCWTPNGAEIGGTRTAIRLAKRQGIKVYNLHNTKARELIEIWTSTRAFDISLW